MGPRLAYLSWTATPSPDVANKPLSGLSPVDYGLDVLVELGRMRMPAAAAGGLQPGAGQGHCCSAGGPASSSGGAAEAQGGEQAAVGQPSKAARVADKWAGRLESLRSINLYVVGACIVQQGRTSGASTYRWWVLASCSQGRTPEASTCMVMLMSCGREGALARGACSHERKEAAAARTAFLV